MVLASPKRNFRGVLILYRKIRCFLKRTRFLINFGFRIEAGTNLRISCQKPRVFYIFAIDQRRAPRKKNQKVVCLSESSRVLGVEKLPKQVFVGSQSVGALNLKKTNAFFHGVLKRRKRGSSQLIGQKKKVKRVK